MLRRSFFKLMSSLPFLGGLGGTLKHLSASARLERLKAIATRIQSLPWEIYGGWTKWNYGISYHHGSKIFTSGITTPQGGTYLSHWSSLARGYYYW